MHRPPSDLAIARTRARAPIAAALAIAAASPSALAIDGGPRFITPRNGWTGFEVITEGDNPAGDGLEWAMPSSFDGLGAQRVGADGIRLQVNHERSNGNATISDVRLDRPALLTAIANTIAGGTSGGVPFVTAADQAYDRWTSDGGATWVPTSGPQDTSFNRFCSGQSYLPDTFGPGRGFVDDLFITGEEVDFGQLFVLDVPGRDLYRLSGHTGGPAGGGGGIAGMPADSWENAALVDTGNTTHVALLLSPDGGSENLQLYIGDKGLDASGSPSTSLLARNGLAFGRSYFLNGSLPATVGTTFDAGFFDATAAGALNATKFEDVDTSPDTPTRVVLGNQNSGVFILDFDFVFAGGDFDATASAFSVTKISTDANGLLVLGDADNVEWTLPTTLGGTEHPAGLVFVNEDNADGQVWIMDPDGTNRMPIGDTVGNDGTESSGVLDISALLGYRPGSIVLSTNQGTPDSLTLLIHPDAQLELSCPADLDGSGDVGLGDLLAVLAAWGRPGNTDLDGSGVTGFGDLVLLLGDWGPCPE